MSYHGFKGLGGPVDDLAEEVASYAGDLINKEMAQRLPLLIAELRPEMREAARDSMRYALADEQLKQALGQTTKNLLWGAVAAVAATSVLTWFLIKNVD